jgi:AcrR family transcriptional regulator
LKSSSNLLDRPSVLQATSIDRPPGLRERQKKARYERILASARSLFNALDFENATMAAIAEHAEVSTPTVFNYFNTKDQLLLALVLQVHQETQKWVHSFQSQTSSSLPDAICDFLSMYTKTSLKTINRQTWRHVESTSIRMPDSDFVRQYEALSEEMFDDFYDFLKHTVKDKKQAESTQLKPVAEVIFNHWTALFRELIRNEKNDLDEHIDRLRADLAALIGMMKIR